MKEAVKKNNAKRKRELVAGLFFVAIISLFIYVAIESRNENAKFLKEGIRTTATINSLDLSGTRKNKNYTMTISMFTEGEKKVIHSDTSGKSAATKVIDSIMDKALSNVSSIGNYQKLVVSITNLTYSKHKVGDKIEVVYLKENPENIKIIEEIDLDDEK